MLITPERPSPRHADRSRDDMASPERIKVCEGCQKPYVEHPHRKQGVQRYCSNQCARSARVRRETIEFRLWRRVRRTEACWLWTGNTRHFGYGVIRVDGGKQEATHRVSWRLHFGEIPDGMCVLHRCDVPACVRPDHLFLGDRAANNADMAAKRRHWSHDPANTKPLADRCGKGHLFTPENTVRRRRGRECRTCRCAARKAAYRRTSAQMRREAMR